jgi:hypothetical protein
MKTERVGRSNRISVIKTSLASAAGKHRSGLNNEKLTISRWIVRGCLGVASTLWCTIVYYTAIVILIIITIVINETEIYIYTHYLKILFNE